MDWWNRRTTFAVDGASWRVVSVSPLTEPNVPSAREGFVPSSWKPLPPQPFSSSYWLPHPVQPPPVRCDGAEETLVGGVPHAEFFAGLFDQLAERRIVNVADAMKQVMLDLEIQSAQEPAQH